MPSLVVRVPATCLERLQAPKALSPEGGTAASPLALLVVLKDLGDRLQVQHPDGIGS